ncbi:hypothetical protein ACFX1R_021097 [Malus domestica]
MNDIFKPFLRKCMLVFFDDILVYSKSWEDHLSHLHLVFDLLRKHQLYVKKQKCSFGQSKVEYIGHIVSRDRVAADPTKIQAILNWPIPSNVKELRGFLGLTGYYRKFMPAFQQLKQIMTSPQVFALPDFSTTFELEYDTSGNGIGAILQQRGRPITFTSQALGPRNQALSTYKRELIAIMHAIKKWQNYLQGRHFVIKSDHNSLKYFLNQRANTPILAKMGGKIARIRL